MDRYRNKAKVYTKDRKRPLGYILSKGDGTKSLFVVGHYETDCGGCDTIPNINEVYALVRKAHEEGMDVLYEGLLISAEFNRTRAIHDEGLPNLVVGLEISLEDCIASVNQRRRDNWLRRQETAVQYNHEREQAALLKGRKPPKPRPVPEYRGDVKERNTKSKWKATQTTMRKLQEAGVPAEWHNRDSAVARIIEALES